MNQPTNTTIKALLSGEDKARKERLIETLKDRLMLNAETERYMKRKRSS